MPLPKPEPVPAGLPPHNGRSTDTPSDDWDLLFDAVVRRLVHSAASQPSVNLRAQVKDCARSLQNLQGMMAQERGRARRIERQLREAQALLATTRADLASTQAGERLAQHQALHDGLTRLPNRRSFQQRLQQALAAPAARQPAFAVLYLDLDGFKPINDLYGHHTGDELLRNVAARLAGMVRADDMVCRMGGDEFACLLQQPMDRAQLADLARQLVATVSAPLQVGDVALSVRASIGIAVCPADGDTPAALIKGADLAMYRAKRRQLGYAFFDRRSDA